MDSVYFMEAADGTIKIGRSANVVERLGHVKHVAGQKVSLLSVFEGIGKYERSVHAAVQPDRLHGEWFSPTPAVIALANAVSPEDLLERIGKRAYVPVKLSDPCVFDRDRDDLTSASRMVADGKALRRKVLARIRKRRQRAKA